MVQEILTPQDRPVRLRLREWAALRQRDLMRLQTNAVYDDPEICGAVVDCFNEAALIEVYYGRSNCAAYLCHAAMKWVDDLVRRTGSGWCYRFAVQPYVNLGRLDRIAKNWEQSLEKIRVAEEVSKGNPVAFGPIILDKSVLEEMEKRFPDSSVLQNIFILDTLKTLLKAGWHAKVPDFFPNWESFPDSAHRYFICEASLIVWSKLKEYDRALELAVACLRNGRQGGNRLVFLYRRAEILACAGQRKEASRIVKNLADAFAAYQGGLTLNKLIVLAALCRLMIHLGLSEVEALLHSGLAAAMKLRDVFLERDCLQMLMQISPRQDARDEIQDRLYALNQTSLYNAARKAPTEGAEVIQELSGQLLAFAGYEIQ